MIEFFQIFAIVITAASGGINLDRGQKHEGLALLAVSALQAWVLAR